MEGSGRGLPLKGKGKKKDENREMRKQRVESHKLSSADRPITLGWSQGNYARVVSQGELLVYVYHRDLMLHSELRSDVGQAASVVRQCVPNGDGRSLVQIGSNAGHIQWT
jgi:hypothetical protein